MPDAAPKKPRLLLIDDETYFVQFFTSLFEDENVEVVAEETGAAGLERLAQGRYDLVVVDYQLPDMLGTEILKHIAEHGLTTPAVMVTGYGTIDVAVQAMKNGAADFFTKPLGDPEAFVNLLTRTLALGRAPEQATMQAAHRAAANLARNEEHPAGHDSALAELRQVRELIAKLDPEIELTRREYEVVTALLRGLSNKEIASALHISERTVKNHLTQIYKKFGIDSRPQLFNKILVGLG